MNNMNGMNDMDDMDDFDFEENMTAELRESIEYCRIIGGLYEYMLEREKNEDYVFNPQQMKKFTEVWALFSEVVKENKGFQLAVSMEPKECHGWIDAKFNILDLRGDLLSRFSKVLNYCTCVGIDEVVDGFCVSMTVPNIYIRKDELADTAAE